MLEKILRLILGVSLLGLVVFLLSSCSSTGPEYKDGRLYALNNTQPYVEGISERRYAEEVWVVYEGIRYDIPFNMDFYGDPTGAGPVELTEEPLLGGTVVRLECVVLHGAPMKKTVDVTIDGNVTVEIYWDIWNYKWSSFSLRVVPGRWDGIHHYAN